jgi:integrase
MPRTLTDIGIARLKPRSTAYIHPDPELRGHYIRVTPNGSKSYMVVSYDPNGKRPWRTVERCDMVGIEAARELARAELKRIRSGLPQEPVSPQEPVKDTFGKASDNWIKRVVRAKQMRTGDEIEASLKRYVYPAWESREFVSLRRSDVTKLLDGIEDRSGSRTADMVLSHLRSIMTWQATRNDDYTPPLVRGMGRHNKPPRDRILADAEIRIIWKAEGRFADFIKLLFLTGQRQAKVISIKWDDIDAHGTWHIATEAREKKNAETLALPQLALQIINRQPRYSANPYVFAGRRQHPMRISRSKYVLDKQLPPLPHWTMHDCRRTSRSLLARAGVSYEIGERVLGHSVGSFVSGIYNRHKYELEKKSALALLAQLLDNIINERDDRVVPIKRRQVAG